MSSDDYVEEVPYAQRAEWADIQPLELAATPVVSIQYYANHKEQSAYFNAIKAMVNVMTFSSCSFNKTDFKLHQLCLFANHGCREKRASVLLPSRLT